MFTRLVPLLFIIAQLSSLASCGNLKSVKVNNKTIPVANDGGAFYLFELYNDKLVLQEYPAFYSIDKNIEWDTEIHNNENKIIGHIIGNHLNYYPITPHNFKYMYCANFGIDRLAEGRHIEFRSKKYENVKDLRKQVMLPDHIQCMIYMMDLYKTN